MAKSYSRRYKNIVWVSWNGSEEAEGSGGEFENTEVNIGCNGTSSEDSILLLLRDVRYVCLLKNPSSLSVSAKLGSEI